MTTTIDAAGRLVIPKEIREAAGIRAGVPLEIRLRNGRVEIEPAPREVQLVRRGSLLVAEAGPSEPLTEDAVRGTRERLRDRDR